MKKKTAVVLAVLIAGVLTGSCVTKNMGYHVYAKGEEDFRIDGSTLTAYLGDDIFVSIPDYVTTIGKEAFAKNDTLQSIELPEKLKTIEYNAFSDCTALKDITLPESVTKVGPGAFQGCTSLSTVEIGRKVESWGTGVFNDCTSLSQLILDDDNLYLSYYNGALYNGNMTFLYQVLPGRAGENYVMPEEVEAMDAYAFWNMQELKNVAVSENVTQIAAFSMSNMGSVENVVLSSSVTNIEEKAFANNSALKQVAIYDETTQIHDKAFSNCPNVKLLVNKGSEAENYGKEHKLAVIYEAEYPTAFADSNEKLEEKPSKTVTVTREKKIITSDHKDENKKKEETTQESEAVDISNENPLDVQEDGVIGKTIIASGQAVVLIGESNQKVYGTPAGESTKVEETLEEKSEEASTEENTKEDVKAEDGIASKESENKISDKETSNKETSNKETSNKETSNKETAENTQEQKSETQTSDTKNDDESQIIKERAYYKQNNLTNYEISEKIKEIKRLAFARSGLTSIEIPDNVKTIGYGAFYACEDLKEVTISDSVESIETKAFADTPWLENWLRGENQTGDGSDFLIVGNGILLAYRGSESKVTLPETVKQIGSEAFKGHEELVEVTIPESVTKVNAEAFRNCTNLKTVNGCKGIKTVIRGAFYGTQVDEDSLR